jgi:hypothetical protein
LWPEIQIVSRTLAVPPEIRNRNGTIEKFREKLNLSLKIGGVRWKFKSPAGGRTSPAKIWIAGRKFKSSAELRRRFRKIEKFSGGLNRSAEEEKVSLENRNAQPKIQIVGGKRSRWPENQNVSRIFGSLAENSKGQLNIWDFPREHRRSLDFGGFPPILLNFRLTIRISGEGAAMPATIPSKPPKSAIFSRTFDRRPAAEKILSKFDMFSDSFVLAADKSRISLTTF